jgi:hypothetical protein
MIFFFALSEMASPPAKRLRTAAGASMKREQAEQKSEVLVQQRQPHPAVFMFEICTAILEHLSNDRRSLSAARLACRVWAAAGAPVQWRAPTFSALRRVPAERAADYGPAVRCLTLGQGRLQPADVEAAVGALRAWRFPGSRTFKVDVVSMLTALHGLRAILDHSGNRLTKVTLRPVKDADLRRVFSSFPSLERSDDDAASVPQNLLEVTGVLGRLPLLRALVVDIILSTALLGYLAVSEGMSGISTLTSSSSKDAGFLML